jgi:hypothetical protein
MGNWIKWVTDDISWAITMVSLVLIVYALGSLIFLKTCDFQVLSTGIAGICGLASRAAKGSEPEKTDAPKLP